MRLPAKPSYRYRRCLLDVVTKHKGPHFACSPAFQMAVKVRTRRVRRAEGKRVCRAARLEA